MSSRQNRYSLELKERAVRLVLEHQGEHDSKSAAINSMTGKIGCRAETLGGCVRQVERDDDDGKRAGVTTSERERLKQFDCENLELWRANEILRKASASFTQAELGS